MFDAEDQNLPAASVTQTVRVPRGGSVSIPLQPSSQAPVFTFGEHRCTAKYPFAKRVDSAGIHKCRGQKLWHEQWWSDP